MNIAEKLKSNIVVIPVVAARDSSASSKNKRNKRNINKSTRRYI